MLIGRGDKLGAVDRLQRRYATQAARGCVLDESGRGRKRPTIETGDGLHESVLVVAFDRAYKLADPGLLAVAIVPCTDGAGEMKQLNATLTAPGPDDGKRTAELGVPKKRRQVVDGDGHSDVINGAERRSRCSAHRRTLRGARAVESTPPLAVDDPKRVRRLTPAGKTDWRDRLAPGRFQQERGATAAGGGLPTRTSAQQSYWPRSATAAHATQPAKLSPPTPARTPSLSSPANARQPASGGDADKRRCSRTVGWVAIVQSLQ